MGVSIRRRLLLWSMITATAGMVLTGCGQKGPLYLPEPKQEQQSPHAVQSQDEND
jgi:predicted small lipoprotein YifL